MNDFIGFVENYDNELTVFIEQSEQKFIFLNELITKKKLKVLDTVKIQKPPIQTNILYDNYMQEIYNQLKVLYTNIFTKKETIAGNFTTGSDVIQKYNNLKQNFKDNIKTKLDTIKRWQIHISTKESYTEPKTSGRKRKIITTHSGEEIDNADLTAIQLKKKELKMEQDKIDIALKNYRLNPNNIRKGMLDLNIDIIDYINDSLNKITDNATDTTDMEVATVATATVATATTDMEVATFIVEIKDNDAPAAAAAATAANATTAAAAATDKAPPPPNATTTDVNNENYPSSNYDEFEPREYEMMDDIDSFFKNANDDNHNMDSSNSDYGNDTSDNDADIDIDENDSDKEETDGSNQDYSNKRGRSLSISTLGNNKKPNLAASELFPVLTNPPGGSKWTIKRKNRTLKKNKE